MAKQINADEESLLKRNARHRLIGAVALTTFVVVTLPLIFDSQPPPTFNSDIELRIPGEPVAPPSNLVAEPTVPTPLAPTTLPANPLVAESKSEVVAAPAVPETPPVTPKEEVQKTVAKPSSPPVVEAKSKVEVDNSKVETDKPKADSKPKETVKPTAPAHTGFALQLGAYANPASAKIWKPS